MKHLFLLRHADAIRDNETTDKERIISDKGISEIQLLAEELKSVTNFQCDLVLCSSATRTTQTWKELSKCGSYNFPVEYKDNLYNPTLKNFITTLKEVNDDVSSILVISHNPTISEFANYITGNPGTISFDTANIACFNLLVKSWSKIGDSSATLKWILPKK